MERSGLEREVIRLRRYTVATSAIAVLSLLGATNASLRSENFDTVTAHRLRIVDNDGTTRLVIANRQNFPPPMVRGKLLDPKNRSVGDQAVVMFYNRDGTEQGGLRWDGEHGAAGGHQFAGLSLDQLEANDNLTLAYGERDGVHHAGLSGQEQPQNTPLNVLVASMDSAVARGSTPGARDSIRKQFIDAHFHGRERFSIGYAEDGSSVRLSDPHGHLRLLLTVDTSGTPRIDFLDAQGRVTRTISQR